MGKGLQFGQFVEFFLGQSRVKAAHLARYLEVEQPTINNWKTRDEPPDSEATTKFLDLLGYPSVEVFSLEVGSGNFKRLNFPAIASKIREHEQQLKVEAVTVTRDVLRDSLDWLAGHPLHQTQHLLRRVSKKTALAVSRALLGRIAEIEDGDSDGTTTKPPSA